MTATDPRHGTNAGYVAGCRQDCCRTAARRYAALRVYDLDRGRPRTVPAIGTQRRVQALAVMGYPHRLVSELAGGVQLQRAMYTRKGTPSPTVRVSTARRVAEVYDRYADTPGPSKATRTRALNKGWAPPIAWDSDTIDDPAAKAAKAAEIARGTRGHADDVHAEDVEFLADNGLSRTAICARLNLAESGLQTILLRAGRRDLWARIRDREELRRRNARWAA